MDLLLNNHAHFIIVQGFFRYTSAYTCTTINIFSVNENPSARWTRVWETRRVKYSLMSINILNVRQIVGC